MLDLDWDAQGHARSLHKGTHAKARFGQPGNELNFSLCAMRLRPASPNHSKLTCRKAAHGKDKISKCAADINFEWFGGGGGARTQKRD